MPRISAPTVAEHRVAQRTALLQAAADLVTEHGVDAVKPAALCARAGLARSSFYAYFSSREDILVALTLEAFERWTRDLEAALGEVPPGRARLRRYVQATTAMGADGTHHLAAVLRQAEISPQRMEDIMALHDALMLPLVDVLRDVGVEDPRTAAPLVNGLLAAAVRQVSDGADPGVVAEEAYRILTAGLSAH